MIVHCATCGWVQGSDPTYRKPCCTDDNMIEDGPTDV